MLSEKKTLISQGSKRSCVELFDAKDWKYAKSGGKLSMFTLFGEQMKDITLKSDSPAYKDFLQNVFSIFILEMLKFMYH